MQSVWAGQLGILYILFVFINVCNTPILPKCIPVYLIHFWCLLAYRLNKLLSFIGRILWTHSLEATVESSTSSKRQNRKSGLNDDTSQNFARREVCVYCWCRIVSIFLSENSLLVIVDIYYVGLSWCRLKSSSSTGLYFLTVLIKWLHNRFAPD